MIFQKSHTVFILMLYICCNLKIVDSCGSHVECDELCCDVQSCKETYHNLITTQNLCTCKNKSEILTTFGGVAKCIAILEPKKLATIFYLSDMQCLPNKECAGACCEDHQKCKEQQCVEVKAKELAQLFYFTDKECSSGKPKCSEICCEDHQQCKENQCVDVKAQDLAKLYYFSDKQCSLEKPKCNGTCCEDYQQCKENQCVEVTTEDLAKIYYFSDKECTSEKAKCNGICCEDHQECKENLCVEVKGKDLAKLYYLTGKDYSLETLKCNGTYCTDQQKCKDNKCVVGKTEDLAELYFFMDKIHASVIPTCNATQCANNQECKDNQCVAKHEESHKLKDCKNKCDKFCCKEQLCNDIINNPTMIIKNCTCLDTTKVVVLKNGIADCQPKLMPAELTPMLYFNDLCCDTENPNCNTSYCHSQKTPNIKETPKETEQQKCISEKLNCSGICCDAHQECKDNHCVKVMEENLVVVKCLTSHTVCSNICCAPSVPCHNNKCICQRGFTERFNQSLNTQYCEPVIASKTPYIMLGIGCILFALVFLIYKFYGFYRSSSYIF